MKETDIMPKSKKPKSKQLKSKQKVKSTSRPAEKTRRAVRPVAQPAANSTPLQYVPWHTIPLEDLNPLLQRQFVVGQDVMLARQPTKRFVSFDELAGLMLYLVSDLGASANGAALSIDGGWTAA